MIHRIAVFPLAALTCAAAESDFLGRCEKGVLMPSGLTPVAGRKYARDRAADVKHLSLEVTPDFTRRSVEGNVSITFTPVARPLTTLELDAVDLRIDAVAGSGAAVSGHEVTKDKLVIAFAQPVPPGTEVVVNVRYHAQPEHGLYFRTPEMGYPQGDTQVWSQGEAEFHRFWFPCYDYPNDRFTTEVICHAPEGMEVISNGRLASKERAPQGGLIRWHWKQEQPHVNYLIALAAGHFHRLDAQAGRTPLALFVPPSEKAQAALAFRDTQPILTFFEQETGTPFPWDKYYQVYCHDFLAGGMENTSCSFMAGTALFPEEVGRLDTVHRLDAHETAHQWFGDLITCRDWSHLWLNEGFASYYTVLYEEQKHGRDGMLLSLWKEAQQVLRANDVRPMVWRDYGEPMEQFDNRAYPKGAWVLHMLRTQLGPELYRAGVKEYIARHRNGIVTTDDLQEALEDVSGRSFDQFFDQWVYHGGVPELGIEYAWDAGRKMARVTVKQTHKVDEKVLLFSLPLPLRFTVKNADGTEAVHDVLAQVAKAQEEFSFTLPAQPALLRVDPDLTVLARINYTPAGDMLEAQLKADIIGRMLAVQQLAKRKDEAAVQRLVRVITEDAHHAIQAEAVEALGQIDSDAARAALIAQTGHADERVRKAVADALAGILHPEAHAALVKMAAEEKNPIIVSAIVSSFAAWPQEDLAAFLKRPSYQNMVAAAAIRTLRQQNRQDAVPAIIAAVKAGGFPARELGAALTAVGALSRDSKDTAVQEFLAGYLTSPHRAVRNGAASALGELGDLRSIPALSAIARQPANPAAKAAEDAISRIQAAQTTPAQTIEAWKKVEALQRRTEELEKKLEALEKKK